MKNKGIFWGVCVVDMLALAGCIYLYVQQDRTAPVISFGDENIVYSDRMETSDLLEGVYAYDKQDGDVSSSLLIEKVSKTADGQVIVTYAARDDSNNVSKSSRIIPNEDAIEDEDVFYDTETGTFSQKETELEIETENETTSIEEEERDNVQRQAEDEQEIEQPAVDAAEDQNVANGENEAPVLTLSSNTILLNAGTTTVDWNDYIQQLSDDRDSREQLFANMVMEGHVDLNTPGSYSVVVYTRDSDGATSERMDVTVIVA